MHKSESIQVPFFRPSISEEATQEVAECIRSGWLTTGARSKQFEQNFAEAVGAKHAVALNSCTAALHLAVEALGLQAGQAVLIPTMTFAATAEIVLYRGAVPILVDCDPLTYNMDLEDAARKYDAFRDKYSFSGIIPVHVAGQMMDIEKVHAFANERDLWVVEDAAHAFPSAIRYSDDESWRYCGGDTARVTCYSFYANKTITTGEGGMAVTSDQSLADRIRQMSLHGLSHDAWKRYQGNSSWDYRIVAPGYKYNMTDVAAAIGLHQLRRAEELRQQRQEIAQSYDEAFADCDQLDRPQQIENRLHSWHLYPIQLRLDRLSIDRNQFMEEMGAAGVGRSVHWRPLHLHTFYENDWRPEDCPVATEVWQRIISLPLFPSMTDDEREHVVTTVRDIAQRHRR